MAAEGWHMGTDDGDDDIMAFVWFWKEKPERFASSSLLPHFAPRPENVSAVGDSRVCTYAYAEQD